MAAILMMSAKLATLGTLLFLKESCFEITVMTSQFQPMMSSAKCYYVTQIIL